MLLNSEVLFRPINKLIDSHDLNKISYQVISIGLLQTNDFLAATKMPYSSHLQTVWTRHWEYATLIIESEVETDMRVLDVGGTGTIFSYFLAIMKCNVHTVDIDKQKVQDAIALSKKMNFNMNHFYQSATNLFFSDNYFDRVFSVCVIEHLLSEEEQTKAMKEMSRVLRPGGILALSYDYLDKERKPLNTFNGCFYSPEEVEKRLIKPSGLKIIGNKKLYIDSKNFSERAPTDYWGSIGCLFLYKDDINAK